MPLQQTLDKACAMAAQYCKKKLLICDRGLLDVLAYTNWSMEDFCLRFGLDAREILSQYAMVIHLESLATSSPASYGNHGNEMRFESLKRAQEIEYATQAAWSVHPNRIIIGGAENRIEEKISQVEVIIRDFLACSEQ